MVIDYIVEHLCVPRHTLGNHAVLARLGRLERLSVLESLERQERAAAHDEAFPLRPLAFHCRNCPANHLSRPYGCFGTIHLPLESAAEEWLLSLLPVCPSPREHGTAAAAQMPDLQRLLRHVQDRNVTGDWIAEQREPGGVLAGTESLVWQRRWRFRRLNLTSDQLLELLFFRGAIGPAMGELLCRALGIWVDGGLGPDGVAEALFTHPITREDGPGVCELKRYFMALMYACSLDAPLHIEPGLDDVLPSIETTVGLHPHLLPPGPPIPL